ncbi:glycosyltransferase family 2 protein [Methylobacterium sp. P5_C11]
MNCLLRLVVLAESEKARLVRASETIETTRLSHARAPSPALRRRLGEPLAGQTPTAADDCLLTILIPCLNEAETLARCIHHALAFLADAGVAGEVLVADNGSTDGSQAIATALGARVIPISVRGYGGALAGGIAAARGRYVIMGDADDSYDLRNLDAFLAELRGGADLVMGNRFRGGIGAGAMPFLHRYLGNPALTAVGRLLFRSPVRDFHCGLRGFDRDLILGLGLRTTGMEFASEMIVRASLTGLAIREVPTILRKDGRSRPPHLRTWRDGWRHLRFLLLHSPRWMFLYPGLALFLGGALPALALLGGPRHLTPNLSFDVHTFVVACFAMLVGIQIVTFGMIGRRYAARQGLLPGSRHDRVLGALSLETLLAVALLLLAAGGSGIGWSVLAWGRTGFGPLADGALLRPMILSACSVAASVQLAFSAFLLGILELPGGDARSRLTGLREAIGAVET